MEFPDESLGQWKNRSGGPRSEIGKARCSRNAVRHGCRANVHFMAHEDRAEYDQLARNWFQQYLPSTPAEYDLVKQIIDAAWRMQRTEYIFSRLDAELFEAALDGSASDELYKRAELHRRYHVSAQNAFDKTIRLFEFFRRTTPPPPSQGPPAEQFVEISVNEDGETETGFNPDAARFAAKVMESRNPLIHRWLAFKDGVIPPEYAWAGPAPSDPALKPQPCRDLLGLQVMTQETWHKILGPESLSQHGHVGPTGAGNLVDALPPPEPAAGCLCPACETWRELPG